MEGKNKLYFGDNLNILRDYVEDATVDLIYLDPPFDSSATYYGAFVAPSFRAALAGLKPGATKSSGNASYVWDFENRLTSATVNGATTSFKYDPFGRRVYKSSSSGTRVYAYDGDNLIEELNGMGVEIAHYTQGPGIDEPLAELRSGTTSFYEADGLGSITSLTNAAGAIANTYVYDSFGNLTSSSGSVTNPFRLTARECDSETGLYYYRARYYDPTVGRFLSEDLKDSGTGINVYPYVYNDPVDLMDPSGLSACPASIVGYIKQVCSVAKAASGPNCPCNIMIIQSGHENTWGNPGLGNSILQYNNFFGRHGSGDNGSYISAGTVNLRPELQVHLPKFSSPQASFNNYCSLVTNAHIKFTDNKQFVSDVTGKLKFAYNGSPEDYKKSILNQLQECKQELRECCCPGGK